MATWVFQGNPERFDIDDYVARYPELIYWRTPRHAKEISVGDRAFLWRSGPNAGVSAVGVVVEAPTRGSAVRHPEALGNDLWRADEPDPDEAKTGIHLREIRLSDEDGYVHRSAAKDDPELSKATIITMPNGTVFPLEHTQHLLSNDFGASPHQAATPTFPQSQRKASEGRAPITGASDQVPSATKSWLKFERPMECASALSVGSTRRKGIPPTLQGGSSRSTIWHL